MDDGLRHRLDHDRGMPAVRPRRTARRRRRAGLILGLAGLGLCPTAFAIAGLFPGTDVAWFGLLSLLGLVIMFVGLALYGPADPVRDGVRLWLAHDPRVQAVLRRREKRKLRGALAISLVTPVVVLGALFLVVALQPVSEIHWRPYADDWVSVTSTALPLAEVGTPLNHRVPLGGPCSDSCRLEVVQGTLPPGITIRETWLEGTPTERGVFHFQLLVTWEGCTPFAVCTADFAWRVHTSEELAAIRGQTGSER